MFGIGSGRYLKILHNRADKIGGGRNGCAINQDMLDQLHRFSMSGVPTELGYPCGHRRILKYCTDPAITSSWEKLYTLYYVKFEEHNHLVRKMAKSSFQNCMQAYKIRLLSSLPIDDLSVENNNFSVFTSTYTVTETCPNNCNSNCSPNSKQDLYFYPFNSQKMLLHNDIPNWRTA